MPRWRSAWLTVESWLGVIDSVNRPPLPMLNVESRPPVASLPVPLAG